MDTTSITRQMIAFQKAAFNNTYSAMILLQEQTETAVNNLLKQTSGLPESGRTAINGWISACKKGREDFKILVDTNFEKVENYFNEPIKPGKSE